MSDFNVMLEPLRVFLAQVGTFLPRLAIALVVVLVGWFVARVARFAIVRGLRGVNFQVVTQRAGLDGFLRAGGIKLDTTEILGLMVYWLVILAALVIGFNSLGLIYVTDLLGRVILFVPKVMLVCPSCHRPTRVQYEFREGEGKLASRKYRVCHHQDCGKAID